MFHHSICGPLANTWSVVYAADGRSDGICRRLGTVPRAEFHLRWSTTWRRKKKPLIIAGYRNNEKSAIPNDVEKNRGTCSPLGLPRDGFLACRMQGKIGLVYQQCRSRLFAKDGVEESIDDGVEEGDDDDKQHFDAGNNNNGGGRGGVGGSGGSNNEEDGNVGDDNTNDGVPWSWLCSLLCKAAASGFNRYKRSGGITAADFGEGIFHLMFREIVFAQSGVPLFELATGLAVLIPLMLPLFFVPLLDVIMGLSIGIVGLSIGLSALVVAWLWWWRSHPDGDEQEDEDEDNDDDHDSPFLKESEQKQKRMWDHLQI